MVLVLKQDLLTMYILLGCLLNMCDIIYKDCHCIENKFKAHTRKKCYDFIFVNFKPKKFVINFNKYFIFFDFVQCGEIYRMALWGTLMSHKTILFMSFA